MHQGSYWCSPSSSTRLRMLGEEAGRVLGGKRREGEGGGVLSLHRPAKGDTKTAGHDAPQSPATSAARGALSPKNEGHCLFSHQTTPHSLILLRPTHTHKDGWVDGWMAINEGRGGSIHDQRERMQIPLVHHNNKIKTLNEWKK